jgi:hypothetical protein
MPRRIAYFPEHIVSLHLEIYVLPSQPWNKVLVSHKHYHLSEVSCEVSPQGILA